MDKRERFESLQDAILAAFDGLRSELWTALPAYVASFDPEAGTIVAQPTIMPQVRDQAGNISDVQMTVITDVPVIFPSGGGFTLTFPLQAGDEVLLVFASKCIDAWWALSGVQPQQELRMHDLSDGFAIPGPRSKPKVISGISTASAQLRSDDGAMFIELAAGHVANITAPGGINFTGPVTFTGTVHANGHAIDETHLHSSVQTGAGNTGPVTP